MNKISPLQLITLDIDGFSHQEQCKQACLAGAEWIQFRSKKMNLEERIECAKEMKPICDSFGAQLIINDCVETILNSDAAGVHLGQNDMNPRDARKKLGSNKIIGITLHNIQEAQEAYAQQKSQPLEIANYAGVGPWRETQSKKDLAPLLKSEHFKEITHLMNKINVPCVFIGGIIPSDIPKTLELGAFGIAVAGGVFQKQNLNLAYLEYKQRIIKTIEG